METSNAYKQIKVYPQSRLEEAIQMVAKLNKEVDVQRGNCGKDEPIETFLDEARYLLTSEETDYSNYMPEDDFSEWVVMENSSMTKHAVKPE